MRKLYLLILLSLIPLNIKASPYFYFYGSGSHFHFGFNPGLYGGRYWSPYNYFGYYGYGRSRLDNNIYPSDRYLTTTKGILKAEQMIADKQAAYLEAKRLEALAVAPSQVPPQSYTPAPSTPSGPILRVPEGTY